MLDYKLNYNGYEVIHNNQLISYEFVNYGYIENNFSEVIIRRYEYKSLKFISESKYYKNSIIFKNKLAFYLELKKGGNKKLNEKNINLYLNYLIGFRGTKQELELELKKFFKVDINISFFDTDIILDEFFIFTYKTDKFLVDVTLFYIRDLQKNFYITEHNIYFEGN